MYVGEETVMMVAATGALEEWSQRMNLVLCVMVHVVVMTVKEVLKAQRHGGLVVELGVIKKRRNWMLGAHVVEMVVMNKEKMVQMKRKKRSVVTEAIEILGEMSQWNETVVCVTSEGMNP